MIDTTLVPIARNAGSSVFLPRAPGMAQIVMTAAQKLWRRPAPAEDVDRLLQAAARREEARRNVDRLLKAR